MTAADTRPEGQAQLTLARWLPELATVLECDTAELAQRVQTTSFTALGGTSLRAVEFAARLARRHGWTVTVGALLEPAPLTDMISTARPGPVPATRKVTPTSDLRGLARVQQAMLFSEQLYGGSAFHLLFSADIHGPLDIPRLRDVLAQLTRRHESLRTVFVRGDDGALLRRVLRRWEPVLVEQHLPPQVGDPVAVVHAQLQPGSGTLLRPFERPPVAFVLTPVDAARAVLSIVVHHVLVDGWSVGLLWREIAAGCAASLPDAAAPSIDSLVEQETSATVQLAARARAEALRDVPAAVAIPSDLDRPARQHRAGTRLQFGLSDQARHGCTALAEAAGLTRNMVLIAAWGLVVARRASAPYLAMGLISAGRTTAEQLDVVGPCMKQLPVACAIADSGTVVDYLGTTAAAVRDALDATDVPAEDVVAALGLGGDDTRNPLVQVAFAAHDELVPDVLSAGNLTFRMHEGHCGGTVYDAVLYVQRWGDSPRLALEYATSVLRADEAADLAAAIDATLSEMAAAPHGRLADVRTISEGQRRRLKSWEAGPQVDAQDGLWQLVETIARRNPDAIAVRDASGSLSYRQLVQAAEVQSVALAAAGVRAGDGVGLAVRRSTLEIVAILAVLRLGAAYTGIEKDIADAAAQSMLDSAGVSAVLADEMRLASLGVSWHGRPVLPVTDPWTAEALGDRADVVPPAASADPERIAYVAFTSGSTGVPKGARIPNRGVVRLVRDPKSVLPSALPRFMRLAPLGFDASTLEIFAPLAVGGTVEVYDNEHLTPDGLAEFVSNRGITGMFLTAGLFRLVADYRTDAFRNLRQVLTGGDVVPPAQVSRVLRDNPGLRVTNAYGPTENTTFTTVHHIDDPAEITDPLPIGRPIASTGVVVLDTAGRLVPPGGIGELFTYGDGLALGYADRPEETARGFGHFSPDVDRLLYRTGDVVRWDGAGRLKFLGRRDHQVKIRGFRIELDGVARVLRDCPGVQDAVVVATGNGAADRRLLAGLVSRNGLALDGVRAFAAGRLPGHAIPSLWVVVPELPVTANGKVDAARLKEVAGSASVAETSQPAAAATNSTAAPAGDVAADRAGDGTGDTVTRAITDAWRDVLGTDRFLPDERFFDVGGDSLQLLRVAAHLRRALPRQDVTIQDLYACQTIHELSGRLRARR